MVHTIRIGSTHKGNFFTKLLLFFLAIIVLCSEPANAQNCLVGSTVPLVHGEGLTEQVGDMTLSCTGGAPGTLVQTYLFISLNATITNAVDTGGNILGITTTVNTPASGTVQSGQQPFFNSPTTIEIVGMQYQVPTPNTLPAVFRVSGIRVAVPTVPNAGGNAIIYVQANLTAAGIGLSGGQSMLVGQAVSTLLESQVINGIPCAGSPLPTDNPLTFNSFINNNSSSSTIRLTEANPASFFPDSSYPGAAYPAGVTNGMRVLVNLSGYGASPSVYVPDAIVGSTGTIPTSGGAYRSSINPGTYSPGQNQLLLALVKGADATGAGGALSFTIPATQTTFSAVTQIPLVSGKGYAVYEVLDSNLNVAESAQVPVFLVAAANTCATSGAVALQAAVAPISNDAQPSVGDPVTRYVATTPANDCTAVGDCSANYFPILNVSPASVTLNGRSQGSNQLGFITVGDGGSSQLTFTATVTYQTASGLSSANWLSLSGSTSPVNGFIDPINGSNSFTLGLSANPQLLTTTGTYNATVTIDAGEGGKTTVPVVFNVGAPGPTIQAIVNSANFQPGPVTANSFVSLFGLALAKTNSLTVTFDGFPAQISYDSPVGSADPSQINVLVPAGLGSSQNAGVVATVDGVPSNTFVVNFVQNAPAVFTPGILNQPTAANPGGTVNLASSPASDGDVVQVFLTGLATPLTGQITVNIGSANGLIPAYTGAVASIPGLEQVNVQVPASLTFSGGSAPLSICLAGTGATPVCSVPVSLYLH